MIYVLFGGFLGALLRFLVSETLKSYNQKGSFPWGILFINVTGSFILGVLQSLSLSSEWMYFCMTGIVGAFTTFSTFSVEAVQLFEKKQFGKMFVYILLSILGSIIGFWIGYSI